MFHIPISAIKYLCAKYTYFFYIGEKRLRGHHSSEETTDPPPHEEGEMPQSQQEEEEGDVVEIVTTTGDCDVVDEGHFTSERAFFPKNFFSHFFTYFRKSQILKIHTVCQHVLSAITGDQCMHFGGATLSSIIK
ncbi:hypothetical protein AB205_0215400 [Aquarana catesbeiana]|uniref:Uncharacterized protein n=1 Tax=Aquarana catesbeiana TaxID=8400 RepID=A0A2G9QA82_AQUCT|nr:hypothetical protein AB205_0215400 [Aquarana catesbeiana]